MIDALSFCTYTQGFWKTHDATPEGSNSDEWPALTECDSNGDTVNDGLFIGGLCYSKTQLVLLMDTGGGGNGALTLAHQYIAAKLNLLSGASADCILPTITSADSAITGACTTNKIAPVGTCTQAGGFGSTQRNVLTSYNEGNLCAPHCSE